MKEKDQVGARSGDTSNANNSEELETEVVKGVPRTNGDATWQAQVYVPRPGAHHNPGGKVATLCVRGPSRADENDAIQDTKKLVEAYREGGVQAARKMRTTLNDEAGRGGWGSSA